MEFTNQELMIIQKYHELSKLNPNVKNNMDSLVYVFVKIMFEHPLVDGNKRLATKYLLDNLGVNEYLIDNVCESLAKENA